MNIYGWIFGALLGLVGGGGGTVAIMKATQKPCPACNCPPATEINLQQFDPGKIVNRKGTFIYSPQIELSGQFWITNLPDSVIMERTKK